MENLSFWIGIIATIAFAVTGVLAIADRGVDLFGVMVLGLITAIGGGTVRDLILETPVFWASLPIYLWVALAASAIAFYLEAFFPQPQIYRWMLYLDGFGAALFGIQGADKAWNMDFGLPLAPVILGSGIPAFSLPEAVRMDQGLRFHWAVHKIGEDLLFDIPLGRRRPGSCEGAAR